MQACSWNLVGNWHRKRCSGRDGGARARLQRGLLGVRAAVQQEGAGERTAVQQEAAGAAVQVRGAGAGRLGLLGGCHGGLTRTRTGEGGRSWRVWWPEGLGCAVGQGRCAGIDRQDRG
ncbi:hypothetical protein RchiOBHm_Chr2g0112611 [Rosa chinensis]|uniref:Uncharacterized protein n=1 Tax=Rosa chinensis TaxID=74649 RepID=A0A2P6RQA9_ROSCH|nr:hypothetical protein RchiOBHm_Chr2g0112611 [Rosa chinensis]